MFVGEETRLNVSFTVARERLVRLGAPGALLGPSEYAYDRTTVGLARVGVRGISKLVRVQVRELARTDQTAGLALRWEATGAGGALFPVLDADLKVTPDGDRDTLLTMVGSYRPPFGPLGQALDRAILRRVADATIQSFVTRVAAQLTSNPVPNGARSPSPPELKA